MNEKIVTIEKAAQILAEKESALILCHIRPDGDTLGCGYALAYALRALGKRAKVLCDDEIPQRYAFIGQAQQYDENESFDLICAVDAAETHMLGRYGELFSDKIGLKLDHHPSGSLYAHSNLIDGSEGAAGQIIFKIIRVLEKLTDKQLMDKCADALYAAIASDTGCFQYSNVTADTMRIAGELIESGADNFGISYRLFALKTRNEINAEKCMLEKLRFSCDGKIAYATFTNSDKEKYGVSDEDFGGLVSKMREIENVSLAITVRQDAKDAGRFKVSMRSDETVSSAKLCALFDGGGHERAAGCSLYATSPEEAEAAVIKAVHAAITDSEKE